LRPELGEASFSALSPLVISFQAENHFSYKYFLAEFPSLADALGTRQIDQINELKLFLLTFFKQQTYP